MKNLLQSLFIGTLLFFFAPTQALEFETIKTKEAPGFFMIKVIAPQTNTPAESLCSDLLVIKNFAKTDAKKYQPLIESIATNNHCGTQTMFGDKKTLQKKQPATTTDIIILGNPIQKYPYFSLAEKPKTEFKEFKETHIRPRKIFHQQVRISHDNNISDIQTNQNEINDYTDLVIIGKFKQNIPSNVTLISKEASKPLPLPIDIPVALDNIELANDPFALNLPNAWNDFKNAPTPTDEKKNKLFPIILFSAGIALILLVWSFSYFGGKQKSKQSKKQKDSFLRNAPETITTDPTIEFDSLPFEIQFPKEK